MARCGCSGTGCSCVITGGSRVVVSGSGTGPDPYRIDAIGTVLQVQDTTTVDLTLGGIGTAADPYRLEADAAIAVADLTDAPPGVPAPGDTLIWDGTGWVYAPPEAGGGGAAVEVGDGLSGDGSAVSPLVLDSSGVWGTAPLDVYGTNQQLGAVVYVDDAGQVRSQPRGIDVAAVDAARPEQYPGRTLLQGPDTYVSTGAGWRSPFQVEGAYRIPRANWGAFGLTFFSGNVPTSAVATCYFHRWGNVVAFAIDQFDTNTPASTSGNIPNQEVLRLPAALAPPWQSPLSPGSAGVMGDFMIDETGVVSLTALSRGNPAGSTPLSISGMWIMRTDDPYTAFAPVRQYGTLLS